MNDGKVIYIPNSYIKDGELKGYTYIRSDFDDEILGKIWRSYDFEKAEKRLFELQCKLSKAVFNKNDFKIRQMQDKIIYSSEAKMLAVRKVSEISKSSAGIDRVIWRKDSDKMRASILLNKGNYKASPLKQFIFKDQKTYKERQVGIPTIYDRAMQVLYSYSLEPVAEATADRKSFAFRKGRSPEQVHACIMDCLTDVDAPEWILISDIKSYYDTISHKWLLENIPMNKGILREFLQSGFIFKGDFFNREEGISLGSNLSTILGNMTLDGLQKRLFDLQGEKIQDFKNGFCIRFADDLCITARTREDAEKFKEEIISFVSERGLKISENKTKIINIKDGFDFLSRFYCKIDGIIRCIPSQKAVDKFEMEVEDIIFSNKGKWTQGKLIQALNSKISGFATYHKCEESMEVFKHLDVIINAFLLKMMKELYKNSTSEQLIKRFWKVDSFGRNIFTVPNNREKALRNMADTVLITEHKIDTSRNVFLDREYFEELENRKDIQNCVGRYKKIWDRQEGKCYICSKEIKMEENKEIIFKRCSKDKTIRNIAYVHTYCKDSIVEYVNVEDEDINTINLRELLSDIDNKKTQKNRKESKFINLTAYFHNLRKNNITLTFKDIEKILKFKLCDSAYKYRTYFLNNKEGMIGETWTSQGYKISNLDLENEKIEFTRFDFRRSKIIIPKFMYRLDLQPEMIEEANRFFLHLQEKYRLR